MYMPGRLRTASRPSRIWIDAFAVAFARAGLVGVDRRLEIGAFLACGAGVHVVFFGHQLSFRQTLEVPNPPGRRRVRLRCHCAIGSRRTLGRAGRRSTARQIRIGITTYLNVAFSGIVISAELFASASSIFTMSWSMLASASIR